MDPNWREADPAPSRGDTMLFIIAKSIGIAVILTGAAWAVTAIAFRYF